jgi:DNA invertase Pin-like site-specific DNA recombinase
MTTDNAARRVAIYCRISQDREGAGLGVERQERDCRALAERLGWEVVEVFSDNDVSAYSGKRRQRYEDLLAAIKRGEVDGLLAWHTDRLHRSVRELLDFLDLLKKRPDFAIQTVRAGQVDLSTPTGRALAVTFGAWAQQESEHKADRQRAKARELAEAGKIGGGGTRPFGFEADRLTILEAEAERIREAAAGLLARGETVHSTCRDWNHRGVLTVTGKRWTPHVFRRMLMSARISGRREHQKVGNLGRITGKAEWPAIISAEDSDRLRELLADPSRTTNTTGNARRYLLSGFAHCGRCGTTIKARPYTNRERSYVCVTTEVGGVEVRDAGGAPMLTEDGTPVMCGRGNLRVHAEALELYVTEAALDYLDEFVDLAAAVRADSETSREAELWSALRTYQERLEKAESEFWVHERMPERTFNRVSGELEANIARVKAELARTRRDTTITNLPTSSAQARALLPQRSFDWRRNLVMTLVERVTVNPGVRGRNRFDPDRVVITFRKPD